MFASPPPPTFSRSPVRSHVLEVMVGSGGLMGTLFPPVGISDIEFPPVVEIFLSRLVVVLTLEFYHLGCLFKAYEIF